MICRITPEILNGTKKGVHTIKVVLLKGQGNIEVKKINDISVFILNGSAYDNEYFWSKFVNQLETLSQQSKVIISFRPLSEISFNPSHSTMAMRKLTKFIKEKTKSIKIALLGLDILSFELAQYFESQFNAFDSLEEAIAYLDERQE